MLLGWQESAACRIDVQRFVHDMEVPIDWVHRLVVARGHAPCSSMMLVPAGQQRLEVDKQVEPRIHPCADVQGREDVLEYPSAAMDGAHQAVEVAQEVRQDDPEVVEHHGDLLGQELQVMEDKDEHPDHTEDPVRSAVLVVQEMIQ